MKKIIITTIIAVVATIILLSAVEKPHVQSEQPVRTQPIITTPAVTTVLEVKEKNTTVSVITKPATSITTTAPVNTATTTLIVTTSEKTNTTTAPATVEKETTTTQPPLRVVTTESTPANGTVRGDKIYVCGFGWIDYEGGGGIGEVNEQMYQNGNKIGYFGGHSDTSKQTQKTKTTQPPGEVIIADTTPANGTIKGDMIYIISYQKVYVISQGKKTERLHLPDILRRLQNRQCHNGNCRKDISEYR